jgi:hypothetical protein
LDEVLGRLVELGDPGIELVASDTNRLPTSTKQQQDE